MLGDASSRRRSSDSGDTLVEILITLVLMGIVAAALLGALMTSIRASAEHKNLAQDDSVVKTALEGLSAGLEHPSPSATILFKDCTTVVNPQSLVGYYDPLVSSVVLPFGYRSIHVTGVACWNPGVQTFDCYYSSTASHQPCTAADTSGLQQITVTGTDSSGLGVSLSTLIRNPAFNGKYTQLGY